MLLAQSLGLNSCWVGGTYKVVNRAYNVDLGQKLAAVVALGYGASQGVPHRSKAPQEVAPGYDGAPEWFKRGVDAALLAPTALNQQKFSFSLDGANCSAPAANTGWGIGDDGMLRLMTSAARSGFAVFEFPEKQ